MSVEYIKIELKEVLIDYTLDFIYNSPKWNKLIFGGGTALKMIGKTARLSEDLDMDYLTAEFDSKGFVKSLLAFFKNLGVGEVTTTLQHKDQIITIKFPILKELGLIKDIKNESNLLYLKIELEKNKYSEFTTAVTPFMKNNLFSVVKHYDLETLFANKIGAILGRKNKIYHDKYDFKGRDFYDLIWFLQHSIKPNLKRLKQIIKIEQKKTVENYDDVWKLLTNRVKEVNTAGIYADMKNLVKEPAGIKQLANNYLEIYSSLVKKLSYS
ncbi:nucleotidyl transferase AbiEii/AbiGii toxin family protein [Patescibacteria group bacterium]|nr:nucleotidyl transferase AbiEii/AbiGii toxin family protein [Patescibacteria group bacterium]